MSDQGGYYCHSRHSCFVPFQLFYSVTSYYKLCCVPAVDENTPYIDMEWLLAGIAELQKFEIPCSVSYKKNQKLFSY